MFASVTVQAFWVETLAQQALLAVVAVQGAIAGRRKVWVRSLRPKIVKTPCLLVAESLVPL